MNSYIKMPITQSELIKWKSNPELNPRTNRKIKEEGKIYKYLKNLMMVVTGLHQA